MRGSIRTSHILKLGKPSDWGTAIANNQMSDGWTLERNKEKQLEKMFTFFFFLTSINRELLCSKHDARSWVNSNECNKYIFAHMGLSLAGETF